MARRSSARVRNRNSSTPKRVSLSHDGRAATPQTVPARLRTLREETEMPGAFPNSASPPSRQSLDTFIQQHSITVPVKFHDSTSAVTPTKSKSTGEALGLRQSQAAVAEPHEELRRLDASGVRSESLPATQANETGGLQGTPTPKSKSAQFTFGRQHSLELSDAAKKFMHEKRQEAAKIKEQMIDKGEGPETLTDAAHRKIATPTGKKGRFSEVHMEQFKKMDSIANHASAFRAQLNGAKPDGPTQAESSLPQKTTPSPSKSLKRSHSRLLRSDEPEIDERGSKHNTSDPTSVPRASQLHRSGSANKPQARTSTDSPSPAKRIKKGEASEQSVVYPVLNNDSKASPTTPQSTRAVPKDISKSSLASPTLASLARASSIKSVKSSKIPAPLLSHSPSKQSILDEERNVPKPGTPLLARSPSKVSLSSESKPAKSNNTPKALLMRTPSKLSPFKKQAEPEKAEETKAKEPPLLSRSPFKMSMSKNEEVKAVEPDPRLNVSLLARSPTKITLPKADSPPTSAEKAAKSSGGNLMGRFNLLRASPLKSPIKSILRSPQRLYSMDPAKVAAGTHLATSKPAFAIKNTALAVTKEETPTAEKHVDFTSSTKARYERAQSENTSTPSKTPTPSPKSDKNNKASPKPAFVAYPSLPSNETEAEVTPQTRRQTAAPFDFTFKSKGSDIIFGQSPNAPASAASKSRSSTIRHVSAEPQAATQPAPATGSKKRKFEFENEEAMATEMEAHFSDKENKDEKEADRPAKRKKPNVPEKSTTKPATRIPTLGVKPKKKTEDSKPKTISKARLNALAQPKRRV